MTYTIRVRGDSSALLVREYECPTHGVFEATEPRNEQPPVWRDCPTCAALSPFVISAPMTRVKAGEVVRGGSDERPPGYLDTRPLADGMPVHKWRAEQTKKMMDDERRKARSKL